MNQILKRPNSPYMDGILGKIHPVLDNGFIRVIDYMGDEAAIVQAARVSYGEGKKTPSDDRSLIRYLMRNWHTTPFEMCEIKLHVKLPIFVARQWIRHRTANVNEYSARYSILDREFYVPEPKNLMKQSKTNKQGRAEEYEPSQAEGIRGMMQNMADAAFDAYDFLIDESGQSGIGLARELARINLPLSAYTQWYWKVDLHNLLHFLRLRADAHAQYEIRVYADLICDIVAKWLPEVWDAFLDYRLSAHTFSGTEMAMLRDMVHGKQPIPTFGGLSGREVTAFNEALGLE